MATPEQDQNRAEVASNAAENILGPNPVVGVRARDILDTARVIVKQTLVEPGVTLRHTGHLALTLFNAMRGKSEIAPDKKDRRFADPAWQESWLHSLAMLAYLATDKEIKAWVDDTNLPELDKERANFVLSLVTDAIAPSNSR